MKIITLLIASGGLLLTMAAPASARDAGHYEHDRVDRYSYYTERHVDMPRWLQRKRGFRTWYWDSPYEGRRAMSWERLYDVYRGERRYSRRYAKRRYYDRYRYDRYYDGRHDNKARRRRHK